MNKKQILKYIEEQAAVWDKIYTDSKALDAGLVLSFIAAVQSSINCPESAESNGDYAGSIACYGSEQLKQHMFKKA